MKNLSELVDKIFSRDDDQVVEPDQLHTLPEGSIIKNHRGEYGVVTDHDPDGKPLSKRMVIRLTKKQAKKLMRDIDEGRV